MNELISWPLCLVTLNKEFRGTVLHGAVYLPLDTHAVTAPKCS